MFGLFGSDDDGGCGGHHFGEWSDVGEYRIQRHMSGGPDGFPTKLMWKAEAKQTQNCQHEGCYEKRTRWGTVTKMPREELSKGDIREKLSKLGVETE